jgi:hypothetical protein
VHTPCRPPGKRRASADGKVREARRGNDRQEPHGAREGGLFCAAADIDHAAVGILASVLQSLEIRGLISREHASRYALTDDGHAVLRAMLSDL